MARTAASGGVTELQIQNSTHTFAADAQASDAYVITLTPAVTAYTTGQRFAFKANTANTGAASLNVNGLGAITIKKHSNTDLSSNDIKSNSIVEVYYDGTNFQMVSMLSQAPAGGGDVSKSGTPANDQIGVWTGDGIIEGDSALTFDTTTDTLAVAASGNIAFGAVTVLDDNAGTTTLQNIDAIDATTEATLEAALDFGTGNVSSTGTPVATQLAVWTDATTVEGDPFLTWDGTSVLATSTGPQFIAINTDSGAAGARIQLFHDSVTPAANDVVGEIQFYGKDSATNGQQYGSISSIITDTTSTSEDGKLAFGTTTAGTLANRIEVLGTASDGTVQSAGNTDLILRTGNATTGNITIADGADGNITVAPNGVGDLIVQSSGTTTLTTVQNGGSRVSLTAVDNSQAQALALAEDGSQIEAYALSGSTFFNITDTSASNLGPYIELYHNSASPAANDVVGTIYFRGEDSAGGADNYATIKGVITDTTSTSEDGKLVLRVKTAGTEADELELTGAALYPTTNNGLDLGTSSLAFNNAYTTAIELGAASDTTISRSSAGVIAVEGVVLPSISSTNTLTNKRVTPRTGTTTSSATPTINTDNVDFYSLTAQTADITSFTTNLSGTPTDGQKLWIAITGTAARAITWGSSFEASTVALPTTTVTTNRLDVGFVWNTATSKWRCVASA